MSAVPIRSMLLAAGAFVFAFVASSVIHMALPFHRKDFAKLPNVTARDDFWHRKYELKDFKPEGPAHVELPNPTIWPLVVAVGLALLGYGFIFGFALSFIGVAIIFIGAYAWSFAKFEG